MNTQPAGSLLSGGVWLRRAGVTFIGAGLLISSFAVSAASVAPHKGIRPFAIRGAKALASATPNTTQVFKCESYAFTDPNGFCYGPGAIRKAYGVSKYIAHGYDGTGETIVIIDAYGSPTIETDLKVFDKTFGLPDPPSFKQIRLGAPFDPNYANGIELGWAEEVALDVQWSHAIAPGAKIILVAANSDSDDDLRAALKYVIDNKLGKIVSESFGEPESDLIAAGTMGFEIVVQDEATYELAAQSGIQVFVSSGDSGASDATTDAFGVPLVPTAVVEYPASSPNVTAVGGTSLYFGSLGAANPNGKYITEGVWNDGIGAGGGGISQIFATPDYQANHLPASTLAVLNGYRGVPDVSYNAGVYSGVLVYLGFNPGGPGSNGFYVFGGTSAGAPQWAGIAAIASQLKGKPIAPINAKLYKFGGLGAYDIISGANGFNGIQGFVAAPSYDFTTGWGSPNAALIDALSDTNPAW